MAASDLGPLGPREGKPVAVRVTWWPLGRLLSGVLLLPLFLLRSNRNRRAWLVLLPFAAVHVLLLGLNAAALTPAGLLLDVGSSLVLGMAALMLLGEALGKLSGARLFLGAVGILMGWGLAGAGVRVLFGGERGVGTATFPLEHGAFAVAAFALALAAFVSRAFCRRQFTVTRFLLWLLLWLPVVCGLMAAVVSAAIAVVLLMTQDGAYWFLMAAGMTVLGLMIGVGVFVLIFPFLVLGRSSPFHAARLRGILGIRQLMRWS